MIQNDFKSELNLRRCCGGTGLVVRQAYSELLI